MELTRADTGSVAVLRVSGPVGSFDGPRLSGALAKALVEQHTCLVCDLSAVTWLEPTCVAVWVAAQWSAPWPGPVVWLTGAHGQPGDALRATGAARFLAVADSTQAALAQQLSGPPLRRRRVMLPPSPTAPGRARRFTAEVLAAWSLPDLVEDATLIGSELVTNGVEHAGSDLELRLEHGRGLLHIAVRDHGTSAARRPSNQVVQGRPGSVATTQERGRGLEIVQALAVACGQTSVPTGGSLYWATLRAGEKTNRHASR